MTFLVNASHSFHGCDAASIVVQRRCAWDSLWASPLIGPLGAALLAGRRSDVVRVDDIVLIGASPASEDEARSEQAHHLETGNVTRAPG